MYVLNDVAECDAAEEKKEDSLKRVVMNCNNLFNKYYKTLKITTAI